MNIFLRSCPLLFAGFALALPSAIAQTRMQVSASSAPLFARPSADAKALGSAHSGEILFVSRVDGDWAAISPPERFDVWLNKDFIENFRVVAKSIQIRSGPGIQYDVVGVLERGAPVMPRGEEGDWCKIAPPSSSVLWVKQSNLSEIHTQTTPIREVAAVPPAVAPAAPKPVAAPPKPKPAPPPVSKPVAPAVPEKSTPPPEPPPPLPVVSAPVKVAPSTPHAAAPKPAAPKSVAPKPAAPIVRPPAPAPAPTPPSSPMASTAAPAQPAPAPTIVRPAPPPPAIPPPSAQTMAAATIPASPPAPPPPAAKPTLRPATAIPGVAKPRPVPPPRKIAVAPAAVPAPAAAVAAQKPQEIDVAVDQALVDDLDLLDQPNQGTPLQIEGELRSAPPFTASAPSRYRLLAYDKDVLEIVCHVHGDSSVLRQYIGKDVSIRGREYWVENSDLPVVVVGQIVPLAPADVDEPVMF